MIAVAPTITARETKVAVNDMTRVRLMESPGPGHGHRGFLVQRNHESGGIVIVLQRARRVRFRQQCDINILQP
jgi:hypothetical protein